MVSLWPSALPGSLSALLVVIRSHLDQRQTRKIKQINSDASDNIPLWLTRPCDLRDTPAEVVTRWWRWLSASQRPHVACLPTCWKTCRNRWIVLLTALCSTWDGMGLKKNSESRGRRWTQNGFHGTRSNRISIYLFCFGCT